MQSLKQPFGDAAVSSPGEAVLIGQGSYGRPPRGDLNRAFAYCSTVFIIYSGHKT